MFRSNLKTSWLRFRVGGESTIETKATRVLSVTNEGVDDEQICLACRNNPTTVACHVDAYNRVSHCRKRGLRDLANSIEQANVSLFARNGKFPIRGSCDNPKTCSLWCTVCFPPLCYHLVRPDEGRYGTGRCPMFLQAFAHPVVCAYFDVGAMVLTVMLSSTFHSSTIFPYSTSIEKSECSWSGFIRIIFESWSCSII